MGSRDVLFLLGSARSQGNAELLAKEAAKSLPEDAKQTWLWLRDYPLPAFEDLRHTDGEYQMPEPTGATANARALLDATIQATDIVFVTPLYWYSVSTDMKRYLDEWSGWLRLSELSFREEMANKQYWAIVSSTSAPEVAAPAFTMLDMCAGFYGQSLSGTLLGNGSKPGEVLNDPETLQLAHKFFA